MNTTDNRNTSSASNINIQDGPANSSSLWADAGLESSLESLACGLDGLPCKLSDLPKTTQDSLLQFFKRVLPPPKCPLNLAASSTRSDQLQLEQEHVVRFKYFNNKSSSTKRIQPRYECKGCPANRPTPKEPYFKFILKPQDYLHHVSNLGGLHAILKAYIDRSNNNDPPSKKRPHPCMNSNNMNTRAAVDAHLEMSSLQEYLDRGRLPCKFSDLPQSTQEYFRHFFKHVLPPPTCPNLASKPELEHVVRFRFFNNNTINGAMSVQPGYECRSCPAAHPTPKDPYFQFTLKRQDYLHHITNLGGLHAILQAYIDQYFNNLQQQEKKSSTCTHINNDDVSATQVDSDEQESAKKQHHSALHDESEFFSINVAEQYRHLREMEQYRHLREMEQYRHLREMEARLAADLIKQKYPNPNALGSDAQFRFSNYVQEPAEVQYQYGEGIPAIPLAYQHPYYAQHIPHACEAAIAAVPLAWMPPQLIIPPQ